MKQKKASFVMLIVSLLAALCAFVFVGCSDAATKYTVTFISGETTIQSESVEEGKVATLPEDPTKEATAQYTYAFDGWYTEVDGGEKVSDFTVTGDITYYAHFTSTTNQYTVKFMNEETEVSSQQVAYGSAATLPEDPTKEATAQHSYTFDGWYTVAEGGEKVSDFTVTGDAAYYAVFIEGVRTYDIKFMNGEVVYSSQKAEIGATVNAPEDPMKESTAQYTYTFDGWYTAAEGGEKVSDFTVKGDATYYARFTSTVNQYTVKFMNGETEVSSQKVDYGTAATKPADQTKEATAQYTYAFDGWYTEADGGEKVSDFTVTGDATYYARFTSTVNQYTIKFISEGAEVSSQTLDYGTTATKPVDQTKAATAQYTYTFDGWYTEADGGKKVSDFTVTGDITYYAHFTSTTNQYTIKFMNGETEVSSQKVDYGTAATKPADQTKEATAQYTYTFSGWYTQAEGGEKVSDFTVTGDAIYYAQFTSTVNQYTITFVCGDNSSKVEYTYGQMPVYPEFTIPDGKAVYSKDTLATVTADATYTITLGEALDQSDRDNLATILSKAMAKDYYVLTGNIYFNGNQFTNITEFNGNLNGQGYAFKNFKLKMSVINTNDYAYFAIGQNKGEIINLGIEYADDTDGVGNGKVAFVRENYGLMQNMCAKVTFEAFNGYGHTSLVGVNKAGGKIINCVAILNKSETLSTVNHVSAIASDNFGYIGGCYAVCNDVIPSTADTFKRASLSNAGTEENNANYETMSALVSGATFLAKDGWNTDLWTIESGALVFGHLNEEEPAVVLTKDNFATAIQANPTGTFLLNSDIDFDGANLTLNVAFSGVLNGQGYALKNLTIYNDNGSGTYMFASNMGTIKNTIFEFDLGKSGNGESEFAALVQSNEGTIENCYFAVRVINNGWNTAPVAGNNKGVIKNCIVNTTNVSATASRIGGLVAVDYNGTMQNCLIVHNGFLNDTTYRKGEMYIDTWGSYTMTNCAAYTTLAELAAAVTFTADGGWNMDYYQKTFAAVLAAKES